MFISAVVPAYNEKGNVEVLVERLKKVFDSLKVDNEIIFVIQGKDGAYESLQSLQKKYKTMKLYYFPDPIGVGPAFREGFAKVSSDADYVLTLDGDLNHDPAELPSFIEKAKSDEADIVVGSRYIKGGKMIGMPLWKKKLSANVNTILSLLYRLPVKDKTSGYRLMKKKVVDEAGLKTKFRNFEFYPEVLLLSNKQGFKMVETPITFTFRVVGESKLDYWKSCKGYVKLLFS